MSDIVIRCASLEDAPAFLEIYSHYIRNTAITFEYEVPSKEEFTERIRHTLQMYPYLAAEKDGKVIGYAYAGVFKGRAADAWACELSVYVDVKTQRSGAGRALYDTMTELLKQMGVVNLYAVIATADDEDAYINHNSESFHEHMGFKKVGTCHQCGYKFDRWYDLI